VFSEVVMSDDNPVVIELTEAAAERLKPEVRRGVRGILSSPWMLALIAFIGIVAIWQWLVILFDLPPILIPGPRAVAEALWTDLRSGAYLYHGATTLQELIWGFVLGSIIGVVAAALLSQIPLLERMFYPYLIALQTFPKIAIAPLLITWFGFGATPKAVLAGVLAFFPVLINMMIGLRAVDPAQIELLRSFKAGRWKMFWLCRFPASMPFFFAAIETGIVLAMLGAITGEFVGAQSGLGYLVVQKNAVMSIDGVFALLIVLAVIGVGLHLAIRAIHRKVVFWE
jgi:NitT/TauT family transport system permease protein